MTDEQIIASQARIIAELQIELEQREQVDLHIGQILYCIGGPLNDNLLGYTKDQLGPFFDIRRWIDY